MYGSQGIIGKENPGKCMYLNSMPGRGYLVLFKLLSIKRGYIIHLSSKKNSITQI